jgi:leucyl aminopeptidase
MEVAGMKVHVKSGNIAEAQVDAIIVNLFEGVTSPGGATGAVDRRIGGLITGLIESGELKGELNETAVIHLGKEVPYRKVVIAGLGESEAFSPERVRQVTATSVKAAAKGNVRTIATIVHGAGIGGLDVAAAAQSVAEGAILGLYRCDAYKSRSDDRSDVELEILEMDQGKVEVIRAAVERGTVLAESANFARDLANAPANVLSPTVLAERAEQMAQETGLECNVLHRADMERLGMGALLGVAQGSVEEPKLVVLRYRGTEDERPYALVGKGITFDSGGISLKPGSGMEAMKGDMSGAAAVIAAMRAIALLKPAQHVIAVAACVENMPSGSAQRPGDIVRTMTGKTIEIISTDAEGRLILADAVAYAESLGAHTIVDVATLTGACVVALGSLYSGLLCNDDRLADEIIAAGDRAGERYWRLPADPEYKEQYKSDIADIKNSGGREAGVITGGLIIGEFIKEARWAHLDIAGTDLSSKSQHYQGKGATGVAVRTLAEFICHAAR